MKIALRLIKQDDFDFLKEVYKSTREQEMRSSDWNKEQINSFIDFQFRAQQAHYFNTYKGVKLNIIIFNNIQIGRLYTWETDTEIRIVDITILPKYIGRGIGTKILKILIDRSSKKGKILNLHVLQDNPALKFYQKLNFKISTTKDTYYFMERIPDKNI